MVEKVFLVLSLLFLFLTLFLLANPYNRVCFDTNCFYVETVSTVQQREKGLMYRTEMADDRGMLFDFGKEDIHFFWMKNTYIPLDIIWINQDRKIIYINKNTPPCPADLSIENKCPNFGPQEKSKYVLEINGGLSEKLGIEPMQEMVVDNLLP